MTPTLNFTSILIRLLNVLVLLMFSSHVKADERSVHPGVASASHTPQSLQAESPKIVLQREFEGRNLPVYVYGSTNKRYLAPTSNSSPAFSMGKTNVVIVGGGLAALEAALKLSEHRDVNVVLIEREAHIGGLAAEGVFGGIAVDRAAAYFTAPYEEEDKILRDIGIRFKKLEIPAPIDRYLKNGKITSSDMWDEDVLDQLPPSHRLFKLMLEQANKQGLVPDQPLEEAKNKSLDKIDALKWLREMPCALEKQEKKSRAQSAALKRFLRELGPGDCSTTDTRMKSIVDLLHLYSRSALGTTLGQVSAMAFANFYISELVERYTSDIGTSEAVRLILEKLVQRPNIKIINSATVTSIEPQTTGRKMNEKTPKLTTYTAGGKNYKIESDFVVFSAQLRLAPKIVAGFTEARPEQSGLMSNLEYAPVSVHNIVFNKYTTPGAYDTWVFSEGDSLIHYTDVIDALWVKYRQGNEGAPLLAKDVEGPGILTVYNTLPLRWSHEPYSAREAANIAVSATGDLIYELRNIMDPQVGPNDVAEIHTSQWPYSIHRAAPGHFNTCSKILQRPWAGIYWANNNLGTPAFEEALFRGHCAAANILTRLVPGYKPEKWSKCPIY